MILTDDWPLLAELLGPSSFLESWAVTPQGRFELHDAEDLLAAFKATPVSGLAKLRVDGLGSFEKFRSTLFELRFALKFAGLGFEVDVLQDETFGAGLYTPDLLIRTSTGFSFLVDVILASSGEPKLVDVLHNFAKRYCLPFDVELVVGEALSRPSVDFREHQIADALVFEVAQIVTETLLEVCRSGVDSGLLRMLQDGKTLRCEVENGEEAHNSLYHELERHNDNWITTFGFRRSAEDVPCIGGGVTDVRLVDSEAQREGLRRKLKRKSMRRAKLPAEHSQTPFLVAIESRESDLRPAAVLSELTGERHWIGKRLSTTTVLPEPISRLTTGPWRPLLEEWDYFNRGFRFKNFGAYCEERTSWAGELSGVLVAHGGPGGVLQWLPNPFANGTLSNPELMNLGLSLNKLGQRDVE